jgi:putative phosphoribosyl transferase
MQNHATPLLHNREQAGRLLSRKLSPYRSTDTVVVGIPPAGALTGYALAHELDLGLHLMPCGKIKHPSFQGRNIGSVTADEIVVREANHDLPQDYIYHQVAMLRNVIRYENKFYYNSTPPPLKDKTVILVDEYLENAECILACLHTLRKSKVNKIVVAIPVITVSATHIVGAEADELVFLFQENDALAVKHYYAEHERPQDSQVREILNRFNQDRTVTANASVDGPP